MDAKADTAMNGTWKKGPSTDLFQVLEKVCLLGYAGVGQGGLSCAVTYAGCSCLRFG